jgi:HEAT repeat protein
VTDHRKWVLRIIGKYGKEPLVALARILLDDPDPEVRALAVDAIADLKGLAGVAALVGPAQGEDAAVAAAARGAIHRLTGTERLPARETPAAEAVAFRAWWEGPDLSDLKVRVVDAVLRTNDRFAEELLIGFALDADPRVALAAHRGLVQVADAAKNATKHDEWMRSYPRLPETSFQGPGLGRAQESVARWWKARPGRS